jgi:hypothetical protein
MLSFVSIPWGHIHFISNLPFSFSVYLFDSLIQANFGDLSEHNISQLFQIILANCFADSLGRLAEDFYRQLIINSHNLISSYFSQSGIPCLSGIGHPSECWHFCFPVLAQLFQKRQKPHLAKSLEPFPTSNAKITQSLERVLTTDSAPELLKNAEFVRFALCWAMASPIRNTQIGWFQMNSTQFIYCFIILYKK